MHQVAQRTAQMLMGGGRPVLGDTVERLERAEPGLGLVVLVVHELWLGLL